jgi:uncharacterized protein
MTRTLPRIALILALTSVSYNALAQEARPVTPHIAAQGTGEVRVAPDRAVTRFGVQFQAKDAQTAQTRVNETMQRVIQAIRRLNIPENRISTERLELFPLYDQPRPNEAMRLTGYRAANVVRVELDVTARVGPVIDAAVGAGANTIEGIQFALANEAPHRREALQQAAREAREKAQSMAAALDAKLDRLLEASEGGVEFIPPRPLEFARADVAAATPVQPGEIVLRATVTVRYSFTGGR